MLSEARLIAEPQLDKPRHVKYWKRCITTLLPHQYTSNDSNRMYLAFLMISALDLLDSLDQVCSAEEKRDYVDWIYHCQHPDGGFRAWPGTDFGQLSNTTNAKWDPANVPATYFALTALLILGDDFQRVRRTATLRWLHRLQRPDGSFGETVVEDVIHGGRDPRFGYCATGVRRILCGGVDGPARLYRDEVEDMDVDKFVTCVRNAESYDGGIADGAFGEPHAGYTFCSLGALNNVGRLKLTSGYNNDSRTGPVNTMEILRWLVHRQTDLIDPDVDADSTAAESDDAAADAEAPAQPPTEPPPTTDLHQRPSQTIPQQLFGPNLTIACAGMNGRTNKAADTCYAWWSGAPFHLLGRPSLFDHRALRAYLLDKTQHPILGGFGKFAGDLPDVYHSYLGLAALSLAGCADVKEVDAGMCISKAAKARLAELWKMWENSP